MTTIALRAAGVMLVLDTAGPKLPRVVHWGADLGELDQTALEAVRDAAGPLRQAGGPDEPVRLTLLPAQGDAWQGRPGVRGHRDGGTPHLRLEVSDVGRLVVRGGRPPQSGSSGGAGTTRWPEEIAPRRSRRARPGITGTVQS